jgi:hypothetical protein
MRQSPSSEFNTSSAVKNIPTFYFNVFCGRPMENNVERSSRDLL